MIKEYLVPEKLNKLACEAKTLQLIKTDKKFNHCRGDEYN